MLKRLLSCSLLCMIVVNCFGANNFMPKRFNTITSHNDVYPYMLNNTKTKTNKTTTSGNKSNNSSAAPIGKRGVIKRKTNARSATTNITTQNQNNRRVVQRNNQTSVARVASPQPNLRTNDGRNNQNVMARSGTTVRARTTTSARNTVKQSSNTTDKVSSQRCFADYKECMETYCKREDTPYNRCYCSAKLAQIDSKYQNKIDFLIQQIIKLQYNSDATSQEIREYWDKTVGIYTGTNPWVNIDNALNIEWPDTQSRIRGQQAFNTGHQYCANNLRACYYMASNMRDAYKSEIARDCEIYEKSLQRIQNVAESVIESYND